MRGPVSRKDKTGENSTIVKLFTASHGMCARTTDYDRNLFETGKRVSQSESETRVIRDPSISWCNRPSLRPTRCIDGRTHSPLSSFAVIFFSLSSTYPARLFSPAANQFSFVSDPTCSSSSSRAPQLCITCIRK